MGGRHHRSPDRDIKRSGHLGDFFHFYQLSQSIERAVVLIFYNIYFILLVLRLAMK